MKAIEVREFGGPEALELREVEEPEVPQGAELVEVSAAGINYADTHQAENSYLAEASLPLVPGGEVVGTLRDGRRVVALVPGGGYAERCVAYPGAFWPVPDGVTDAQALALVLQGATAWHLLRTSAQLREGESVVVHAAAGGVGTLGVQLAKRFGAGRVIGVASSPEKRSLAERLGADAVVDSGSDDLTAALRKANGGDRVDVILEMIGGDVFAQSLKALAPFGRLVHFGQAARGGTPDVNPGELMGRSQGVLGFWLVHLTRKPELMTTAMEDMFAAVEGGDLEVVVGGEYPLDEARRAHEDLRARRTTGKLVLRP
ncbi:MAG TPA: zinc-binding dehydrogenase [Thermoleophilaceae bacterium]|nr:zinc-binding dehydrogenase [Thermoleophilaceae bacterium]